MANKGWDSTQGGTGMASNARTTGRTSGTGDAESFIRPAAVPTGAENDPMDSRADLFSPPGQASAS